MRSLFSVSMAIETNEIAIREFVQGHFSLTPSGHRSTERAT